MYDVVIIGAGTAGMTAAVYAARASLRVLVLEQGVYGGQIVNALHVENYPGIAAMSGADYALKLQEQAAALGAQFAFETALGLKDQGTCKVVFTAKRAIECHTVILASGAANRRLNLTDEQRFVGRGISYCATCDGAMFKGKTVAVIGGGISAVDDALFLSSLCEKVFLIHRREVFRADARLIQALREKNNVEWILHSVVTRLLGSDTLLGLELENVLSKEKCALHLDGLFVAIGQQPQNAAFSPPIALDSYGYIVAGEDCLTNINGVFAAGDCRTKEVRQLVTAAADGAVAAVAVSHYLSP